MILSCAYLGLGLLLLSATLGMLYPRIYGRMLAPLTALWSLVLFLFTPQFILLGVLLTGLFAWAGALRHPAGQIGLCLHGLSWALLLRHLWHLQRALPVLDGKEVRDQDHPFTDRMTEDERRQLKAGQISWRPLLTYKIPAMLSVQVTRRVIYREVDGVRLRVDVYRSRDKTGPLPAALYIHGGAWIIGGPRQSQFMLYELAAEGWVVFAISYRFAPRFPLPAAIEDCKAAVAFIREHGHEYGTTDDEPVVLGGSAGGHLASMVALTPCDPRFQPGFEQANTRVKGAVIFYGVPDFESVFHDQPHAGTAYFYERVVFRARYKDDPERFRRAQPMSYLSSEAPPLLLVHGTSDGLVPIESSRRFYQKLKEAGAAQVHLLEVPHALHAFEIVPSPLHQRAVRVLLRFLATLKGPPQAVPTPTEVRQQLTGAEPGNPDDVDPS